MTEFWKTTREWEGETCAVLGSGPGMTVAVAEAVRASGVRAIAVNNQAIPTNGHPAMAPWADILYAADAMWWAHNKEAAAAFAGRKVTICPNNGDQFNVVLEETLVLGNGGATGFDERPTHLRTGHNSGYQAVHLAAHLGVARILLCGFDMHDRRGKHWFGEHAFQRVVSRYDLFMEAFASGAPAFAARGIVVINCTPDSALKCFPFMELEEALRGVCGVRKDAGDDAAIGAEAVGRDRAGTGGGSSAAATSAAVPTRAEGGGV